MAFDTRVDTSYRKRSEGIPVTAQTVAALCRAGKPAAVFFSSYAYAETVARELAARTHLALRSQSSPGEAELSAQSAWVEDTLNNADALFLVLGSSLRKVSTFWEDG